MEGKIREKFVGWCQQSIKVTKNQNRKLEVWEMQVWVDLINLDKDFNSLMALLWTLKHLIKNSSVELSLRNMKLSDRKLYELVFKATALIAKVSGFSFFSMKSLSNCQVVYRQSWIDYALFVSSLSFSFLVTIIGSQNDITLKVNSQILSLGMAFLIKVSFYSVILTKLVNVFSGRNIFNVMLDFKWMYRKVSHIFYWLYNCGQLR